MAACIKQMHKDYYKSVLIERESKGLRGTVVVKIEKTLYEKETLTIE